MSIKRGVLLLVLCLVALAIAWQSQQVRPLMQYGFQVRLAREEPAGDAQAGAGEEGGQAVAEKDKAGTLPAFLKRFDEFVLEQGDSLVSAALTAHLPAATLSTEQGGSASAELTTVYGALHTLVPGVLLSGRLLYQEEVDAGAKVAVLDEGLAIALFRQGDPVGLRFTLLGQELLVVGVVRHQRGLGDRAEYGLMAPLSAFPGDTPWEMMLAQLAPKGSSGVRAGLVGALTAWQPGGQAINLAKEQYRTLLPLRVLVCLLLFSLSLAGLAAARKVAARMLARARALLEQDYVFRLLPRLVLMGLCVALAFAAALALMALALTKLVEPVYVFPEWVPAIPVEPREIARTFWQNRSQASSLVSYRSRELLSLRAQQGYLTACAALAGGLLISPLSRLLRWIKGLR